MRVDLAVVAAWLSVASGMAAEPVPGTRFFRHWTDDGLGRRVAFFVSAESREPSALALFVGGSGCAPAFRARPDGTFATGYQGPLLAVAKDRFRVVVVEKPGVDPAAPVASGTAESCPRAFNEEHTLDRWVEALRAALAAAKALPGVTATSILAIGHSEGATAVARLGRIDPGITHIAILSGSALSQFYDFIVLAQRPRLDDGEPSSGRRVAEAASRLAEIRADPQSVDRFAWGHPHRRWTSFFAALPLVDLLQSKADLFLAHGTADASVPIESFDILQANLAAAGRKPRLSRLADADHSLNRPHQRASEGMASVFVEIADWFSPPMR
jgi:predicted esterase